MRARDLMIRIYFWRKGGICVVAEDIKVFLLTQILVFYTIGVTGTEEFEVLSNKREVTDLQVKQEKQNMENCVSSHT